MYSSAVGHFSLRILQKFEAFNFYLFIYFRNRLLVFDTLYLKWGGCIHMVSVRKCHIGARQNRIIPQGFGLQQKSAWALHVIKE